MVYPVQGSTISTQYNRILTTMMMYLQSDTGMNEFDMVSSAQGVFYNSTKKFDELSTSAEVNLGTGHENRLAVLLSASADVHVFGIKSDKGTTDGFMALPLTTESKEFFIAAWK